MQIGAAPLVRGEEAMIATVCLDPWITPARAGTRNSLPLISALKRDHPRMRGDKVIREYGSEDEEGSPPHARG